MEQIQSRFPRHSVDVCVCVDVCFKAVFVGHKNAHDDFFLLSFMRRLLGFECVAFLDTLMCYLTVYQQCYPTDCYGSLLYSFIQIPKCYVYIYIYMFYGGRS